MLLLKKIYAWSVHLFTSLGAVLCVLAIILCIDAAKSSALGNIDMYNYYMQLSLFSIIAAVFVDAIDGTLARLVDIKNLAPLDGALLDNIIDFSTYSIVPCIWIYVSGVVSEEWIIAIIAMITISSSYQFCQPAAKSADNFFVGFPSYWNMLIIYMICFQSPQLVNEILIIIFAVFSFIPIKYIYLSRTENISSSKFVKTFTFSFMMLASVATIIAVLLFPIKTPSVLVSIILAFAIFYIIFSIKLNIKPVVK